MCVPVFDTSGGRAVRSGWRRFGHPRAVRSGAEDRHTQPTERNQTVVTNRKGGG